MSSVKWVTLYQRPLISNTTLYVQHLFLKCSRNDMWEKRKRVSQLLPDKWIFLETNYTKWKLIVPIVIMLIFKSLPAALRSFLWPLLIMFWQRCHINITMLHIYIFKSLPAGAFRFSLRPLLLCYDKDVISLS